MYHSTPTRASRGNVDGDSHDVASLKLVPFDTLKKRFDVYASTSELSHSVGGTAGLLITSSTDDGEVDSLRLSRAFIDSGVADLKPKSYTGVVPIDADGRSYIASVEQWKDKLTHLLGAPRHLRTRHDLVGVNAVLLFCGCGKKGGDRITLSGSDSHLSFEDAHGGVFAYALR